MVQEYYPWRIPDQELTEANFFITHIETAWLNGKHTVFGKVIEGQDIVDTIAQGDLIETLEIVRLGDVAKSFKCYRSF